MLLKEEELTKLKVIGKSLPRKDAVAKATGTARYAADYYFPGMIYAKTLRTPVPRARIKKIDVSEALKLPGVLAVVTAKDVPFLKRFGFVYNDVPPLIKEGEVAIIDWSVITSVKRRVMFVPLEVAKKLHESYWSSELEYKEVWNELEHEKFKSFEEFRQWISSVFAKENEVTEICSNIETC